MRPPKLGTLYALAACLILSLPATALATPKIGAKDNGLSITEERGLRVYVACWDAFKSQCGRNIVDDGLTNGSPPTTARVKEWTGTMERWLHPPAVQQSEPVADDSNVYVAPTPTPSSVPTSSGGCPSYMAAEASSPDAVNPTSGAAGCFQILPSTAAAHGCTDVGPSCAAAICATEGPAAWASSGANPCPYVQP